ncbi:MAG: hypothetical protein AAF982_09340, partial [Pseudomonadota bacterium]
PMRNHGKIRQSPPGSACRRCRSPARSNPVARAYPAAHLGQTIFGFGRCFEVGLRQFKAGGAD